MKKIELKISNGFLKNKKIPITFKLNQEKSNFSSSKLKEAAFSIIDSQLKKRNLEWENVVFVDCFSGSGQMGIEAISLGCENVEFFEISKDRFNHLINTIKTLNVTEYCKLHNKDVFRYLKDVPENISFFFVFYLDPPYTFFTDLDKFSEMAKIIKEKYNNNSLIIIQSPNSLHNLSEDCVVKNYGNSYLNILFKEKE